jgi:hypothetical protein
VSKSNPFNLDYYGSILVMAKQMGYKIMTVEDFWSASCPKTGALVLRHDVDVKPHTLEKMLDVERYHNCRSTLYVRICGAPYNFLNYPIYRVLSNAEHDGFRIGLHTNYVEFANINNLDPMNVLTTETNILKSVFPSVSSLAPHRDHDYVYNSLPHLEEHWTKIAPKLGYAFHAYDNCIKNATEYVNEGYELHLTWRNKAPDEAMKDGKSIYMLTHSHWWHKIHPFEDQYAA